MAYPGTYQIAPPCATQDVLERSQLGSGCTRNFRYCGFHDLLPCLPNHQCSQIPINPNYNPIFIGSQPPETFGWDDAMGFSATAPEDPPLQMQSADEVQNTRPERSGVEQDLIQVVSALESRVGKLAEVVESLRDEIEEKTSFFAGVEAYIKGLVEWTKDSKQATDILIAELKEAVNVANRDSTLLS